MLMWKEEREPSIREAMKGKLLGLSIKAEIPAEGRLDT